MMIEDSFSDCFQPLVSIVIPCWNAQNDIGAAIRSALAQTYARVEVIVIDDGSSDKSLEVIRSFNNEIVWRTGPNRGACAARNFGLGLARGQLVQFLDADDRLHPNKLTHMVPVAVEKGAGGLVVCDWERTDIEANQAERMSLLSGEDEVVWCARRGIPTPSPLHWKKMLQQAGGFDESLPCAQERDLHLRLACHGLDFYHVPEVLVSAHRRSDSLSSDSLRVLRQHPYIVSKARELLEQLGRVNDQRLAALAGLLARDARIFLYEGLTIEAQEYFDAARTVHSGGGLALAYKPLHKAAARLVGPALFERMVRFKRGLGAKRSRGERIAPSA